MKKKLENPHPWAIVARDCVMVGLILYRLLYKLSIRFPGNHVGTNFFHDTFKNIYFPKTYWHYFVFQT